MNTNRNLRLTDLTQAERAVLKVDNLQELPAAASATTFVIAANNEIIGVHDLASADDRNRTISDMTDRLVARAMILCYATQTKLVSDYSSDDNDGR